MIVQDCLQTATKQLQKIVGDRALFEARLLLSKATGLNPLDFIRNPDLKISDAQAREMESLLHRRLQSEPIAYLLGQKEFFGFEFEVNSSVLIPRPETEALVKTCSEWLRQRDPWKPRIVDLGTGSGCILLSLALLRRPLQADFLGIDISKAALETAERNRKKFDLQNVFFRQADLGEPPTLGDFDLIVSNPPYIPSREIESLAPDIRNFEPHTALDGGVDGMHFYDQIIQNWLPQLRPKGLLALETHDENQRLKLRKRISESRNGHFWIEDCHIFFEAKD